MIPNITLSDSFEVFPGITKTCWNWCSEQAMIHQSNIDIKNLGVIGVAMGALLIYTLCYEWSDELGEYFNADESKLEKIQHYSVLFAFMLLAVFLIYYAYIN